MLKIISATAKPSGVTMVHLTSHQSGSSLTTHKRKRSLNYGLGNDEIATGDRARYSAICRGVIAEAERRELPRIALDLQEFLKISVGEVEEVARTHAIYEQIEEAVRTLAVDLHLASYKPGKYKTDKKGYGGVSTVYILNTGSNETDLEIGNQIGIGANECRGLVDEPSNFLFPMEFGERAKQLAAGLDGVTVSIKDYDTLQKEGFGLLCAVGKGAENKPCLIEVAYMGSDEGHRLAVINGKGVTLDTGGYDIKLSGAIQGMQKDMAGGAAALMAVIIAARLKLAVNAIAIIPSTENLVSDHCYRTMDVHTSYGGRTVEVRNTDAEGRLILEDANGYAMQQYDPSLLVTVATLTGAVRLALADLYTGVFCNRQDYTELLCNWGQRTRNPVWPLPYKGYEVFLKSDIADIANVAAKGAKDGGACVAAAYLAGPTKDMKGIYVHLDIAGTAMEGNGRDGLFKGAATGVPVPLLVRMLEKHQRSY